MRAAAKDMALLMGLRLAVDEDRPLPYSTTLACRRLNLGEDPRRASRVLRSLVRAEVVLNVGRMPRRPGGPPDGTKLYLPPGGFPDGASVIEAVPAEGLEVIEPSAEQVD